MTPSIVELSSRTRPPWRSRPWSYWAATVVLPLLALSNIWIGSWVLLATVIIGTVCCAAHLHRYRTRGQK